MDEANTVFPAPLSECQLLHIESRMQTHGIAYSHISPRSPSSSHFVNIGFSRNHDPVPSCLAVVAALWLASTLAGDNQSIILRAPCSMSDCQCFVEPEVLSTSPYLQRISPHPPGVFHSFADALFVILSRSQPLRAHCVPLPSLPQKPPAR